MNDAIDFSFYPEEQEQKDAKQQQRQRKEKQQQEQEEELANADLLRQFRQLFAPIVDDSLQLYYQLNESDTDVQHIRVHRTVAELNELTSSEEETLITQLNSPSPLPQPVETPPPPQPLAEEETPSVSSIMSSTSSSCLYAIHTPSPAQRLESPQSEVSEAPLTITEQVQLHAPPSSHGDNNNIIIINDGLDDDPNSSSHNNTSCSISSTLTDSKTLDGRTPIVV